MFNFGNPGIKHEDFFGLSFYGIRSELRTRRYSRS